MGKRKKAVPTRVDDEKRRCLTWNMLDGTAGGNDGSLSICSDNDPELLQELANSSNSAQPCSSKSDDGGNFTRDSYVKTVLESYLDNCLYCVSIQRECNFKKNEWNKEKGREIVDENGTVGDNK